MQTGKWKLQHQTRGVENVGLHNTTAYGGVKMQQRFHIFQSCMTFFHMARSRYQDQDQNIDSNPIKFRINSEFVEMGPRS